MVHYDPLVFYDDPYLIYRQLRDTAPAYHNDERSVWVLSRYHDIQTAARDWQTYSSGHGTDYDGENASLGPGDFLDLDPPRHDELRHLLRKDFTPKRIKHLEAHVRATVKELIDALVTRGGGDFAKDFAQRLPLTMICHLLGVPREDHHLLEDWFVRIVQRVPGKVALPDDVWRASAEMRAYIDDAVALRRKQPRDDVLGTIAVAESSGQMSAHEIHGMTQILLLAGIHTTSSLIANSLVLLAPHPQERRRLAADPQSIPVAIEEVLRFASPVRGAESGGQHVAPRGTGRTYADDAWPMRAASISSPWRKMRCESRR